MFFVEGKEGVVACYDVLPLGGDRRSCYSPLRAAEGVAYRGGEGKKRSRHVVCHQGVAEVGWGGGVACPRELLGASRFWGRGGCVASCIVLPKCRKCRHQGGGVLLPG